MASVKMLVIVLYLSFAVHASPQKFELKNPSNPFKFYTRADWEAVPPTDVHPIKQPVPYVVIHHTYLPAACYSFEDCALKMRSMQKYHNSFDWGDIGYHFCVGSEGSVYEGRGWNTLGIHAGKANKYSYGICLIGDWRVELPPKEQLETTKALIAEGVKLGKISSEYKLVGHNQVMATECPGRALSDEISTWDHFAPGKHNFNNLTVTTTSASFNEA